MTKQLAQPSFVDFFKGKTVTLMGLGLLGRGVGDAAFLAQHCRKLYVTDIKSADELQSSVAALEDYSNIEFHLGCHSDELFISTDMVIKGAGVRLDNPYIKQARDHNVPVYMSTALFASLAGLKIIGVTGTRGKTTTTSMIATILQYAGKKVLLGGNIRGVSTLALLPQAGACDVAVLELDSWQLQGFDELKLSPAIAVFTNFYPDHMNYYDGDMGRYFQDKAAIFRHQQAGDTLVTSDGTATLIRTNGQPLASRLVTAPALSAAYELHVPGAHNRMNAGLALAAARAYGIDDKLSAAALRDFTAVEGRLQKIGSWQSRDFYNDSNATTQEATLAALTSFPPQKTVLIFGGADKGLPLDALLDYIRTHSIRCVLIKGTGSDRILARLPQLPVVESMHDAVRQAQDISKPDDVIILSPAFASFGVFKNEYDRSDQFLREVQNTLM